MSEANPYSGRARYVIALAAACFLLLMPSRAAAWGDAAHIRIATLALENLPASRSGIALIADDVIAGATAGNSDKGDPHPSPQDSSDTSKEVDTLAAVLRETGAFTHYFSYRMGMLSRAVADSALPLALSPDPRDRALLRRLERDIDSDMREDAESYRALGISGESIRYPSIYLDRIAAKSNISRRDIRAAYTSGDGYREIKSEVSEDFFYNAVEAVTNLWLTIQSTEAPPRRVSAVMRQKYYIDQVRTSSTKGHLNDILAALLALQGEAIRIPMTPAIVGDDFFDLPCNDDSGRIYKLAMLLDPRSAVMAEKWRACERYVEMNPAILRKKPPPRRKIPSSLHGRNGEEPDIFVYEHRSGVLLLSSKIKQVGSDYVPLNFEPVKKILSRSVVRRIGGDPGNLEYDLEAIINSHAKDYGVHPAMVKAIIKAESDFNPLVVSRAGARGLMQLMPPTALEMQVDDPFDPIQNVGGGVQYFARMLELFDNDTELALAAYNAGPGNVLRYGGIPPFKETRKYVPKVLKYYDMYKKDTTPVKLKVALNKVPAPDYLPETEVVKKVREIVSTRSSPKRPDDEGYVIVYFKNGNTMRGIAYERTDAGVRLMLDGERGWILIREDFITNIS
jgi:hypothetical protein